jgi:hypothetical protein
MTIIIKNSQQLVDAIDERRRALKRTDSRVAPESGISTSALGLMRKRGGNMNTDTMFALAKVLGLTITIETKQEAKAAQTNPTTVNQHPLVLAASARPQPYITDIKIIDLKDDRWALLVKKSDRAGWVSVPFE